MGEERGKTYETRKPVCKPRACEEIEVIKCEAGEFVLLGYKPPFRVFYGAE